MKKFIYMCALEGVSDFIYNLSTRPPKWMNKKEGKAWRTGFNYARNLCRR